MTEKRTARLPSKAQSKSKKKTQPRYNGRHPGGRPPLYDDPAVLQAAISKYFDTCRDEQRPRTMMGLALALNMSRQAMSEYAHIGKFGDLIKRAHDLVEEEVEARLFQGAPTGAIFWLKNHAEYHDDQRLSHTGQVTLVISNSDLGVV